MSEFCQACMCPACVETKEIRTIVAACDDMGDLPERVFEYWERQRIEAKEKHPNVSTVNYFKEGKLVRTVTTEQFPETVAALGLDPDELDRELASWDSEAQEVTEHAGN